MLLRSAMLICGANSKPCFAHWLRQAWIDRNFPDAFLLSTSIFTRLYWPECKEDNGECQSGIIQRSAPQNAFEISCLLSICSSIRVFLTPPTTIAKTNKRKRTRNYGDNSCTNDTSTRWSHRGFLFRPTGGCMTWLFAVYKHRTTLPSS